MNGLFEEYLAWPLLVIAAGTVSAYAVMLLLAVRGWKRIPVAEPTRSPHHVSIIIAARNEEHTIGKLLEDLSRQHGDHTFEMLVVDDGSEDATLCTAQTHAAKDARIKVLCNKHREGKKGALETGLDRAEHAIIATVDADCHVGPMWLQTMLDHWEQNNTRMLLGPVLMRNSGSFIQHVQSMEMLAIMGLTGGFAHMGHPIMANGANLFFDRESFEEVGGYSLSRNPSGDDVYTMLAMHDRWPGSVRFVKNVNATVSTDAQPDLRSFWQQRKRWLSKKGSYRNKWVNGNAIITYLANVSGLVSLVLAVVLWGTTWSDMLFWVPVVKTIADLILIRTVRRDLQPECGLGGFLTAELFILSYVSLIGLVGNVRQYVWKGRSVSVDNGR